jgi:hypothetical protein
MMVLRARLSIVDTGEVGVGEEGEFVTLEIAFLFFGAITNK